MKTLVMLLMSAWWTGTADAFQIVATPQGARCCGRSILMATTKQQQQDKKSQSLGFVSDWQQEQVDMKRAKDCAEHFGSCPTEEVQGLRDSVSSVPEESLRQTRSSIGPFHCGVCHSTVDVSFC